MIDSLAELELGARGVLEYLDALIEHDDPRLLLQRVVAQVQTRTAQVPGKIHAWLSRAVK